MLHTKVLTKLCSNRTIISFKFLNKPRLYYRYLNAVLCAVYIFATRIKSLFRAKQIEANKTSIQLKNQVEQN